MSKIEYIEIDRDYRICIVTSGISLYPISLQAEFTVVHSKMSWLFSHASKMKQKCPSLLANSIQTNVTRLSSLNHWFNYFYLINYFIGFLEEIKTYLLLSESYIKFWSKAILPLILHHFVGISTSSYTGNMLRTRYDTLMEGIKD